MKSLTIFTPTYNRAYCLHLLYESLCRQTSDDFLWLVIDDGSVDNTKALIHEWILEDKIKIQYFYKENGGMHTGHNAAYALIETPLNVCIDSDDFMPDDAVLKINTLWEQSGNSRYAGMIGLDIFAKNHNVVGSQFPEALKESRYSDLKPLHGVWGDKKIVFRTDVVKQYDPYPVFTGEKFVPLYLALLVDQQFSFLCFNEVFCIVDYQEDGSTLNIYNQYFRNPKGFSHFRKLEMIYRKKFSLRFKSAVHYVMTSAISKNTAFLKESPRKLLTLAAITFGTLLYFYLSVKRNKKRDISKYVKK